MSPIKELSAYITVEMEPIDIKSRCSKVGTELSSDQESLFNRYITLSGTVFIAAAAVLAIIKPSKKWDRTL